MKPLFLISGTLSEPATAFKYTNTWGYSGMPTKGISRNPLLSKKKRLRLLRNAKISFSQGHSMSRGLKDIACSSGIAKMAIAWPSNVKWSLLAAGSGSF
jgi:hypothetical protein